MDSLSIWHFIVIPIVISLSTVIITYTLHKKEKRREEKEALMAKLLLEKETLKQTELTDWRNRYEKNICDIKSAIQTVTGIANDIDHKKVEVDDCEKKSQQKWHMITHHEHTEDGKVVIL